MRDRSLLGFRSHEEVVELECRLAVSVHAQSAGDAAVHSGAGDGIGAVRDGWLAGESGW